MQPQAQAGEVRGHGLFDVPESVFVVAENDEIVTVADIGTAAQCLFDEVIEAVEIDIGEELAGEVADGKALATGRGREQIIAREIVQYLWLEIAGVDNLPHEPAGTPVPDRSAEDHTQDVMVDAGKVLRNVSLEDIAVLSAEPRETLYGGMRAFPLPTGIGVVDEGALEERLDDAAQGMVHDAVAIRRGTDEACLGLANGERSVGSRTVALR